MQEDTVDRNNTTSAFVREEEIMAITVILKTTHRETIETQAIKKITREMKKKTVEITINTEETNLNINNQDK